MTKAKNILDIIFNTLKQNKEFAPIEIKKEGDDKLIDIYLKKPLDYSMAEDGPEVFKGDWDKFMGAIKEREITFNSITISSLLFTTPITLNRDVCAPYGHTMYKLVFEALMQGASTKEAMREWFENDRCDWAHQAFKEYSSRAEIEEFFKDKDVKNRAINWKASLFTISSQVGANEFFNFMFEQGLVAAAEFLEPGAYQARFNDFKAESVNFILNRLDLRGKKDRQVVKNYLKKAATDFNTNKHTFSLIVNFCVTNEIDFNLDEIIKVGKSASSKNSRADYTELYQAVRREDAKQLLYLLNNDFLPGKEKPGLIDGVRAKAEKLEIEKALKPNQMEQFIIEKGLGQEFEDFRHYKKSVYYNSANKSKTADSENGSRKNKI